MKSHLDIAKKSAQLVADSATQIVAALEKGDVGEAERIGYSDLAQGMRFFYEYMDKILGKPVCELCNTAGHTILECEKAPR